MRICFSSFAICVLAIILSTTAFAQDPPRPFRQRHSRHPGNKLKKMDTNQDGQITRDEWKGRDRGFQRADRNNDGVISREEALAGRQKPRKRPLKQMDTDKNGQISRGEWLGNPDLFGKLDQNNDGVITKEELKNRRRRN
ncbi:MAG: hypothetical protein JST85_08680 [Acidobacteria bacterium]|nr:hypothetical protein [Acidobacteriota bacterium]